MIRNDLIDDKSLSMLRGNRSLLDREEHPGEAEASTSGSNARQFGKSFEEFEDVERRSPRTHLKECSARTRLESTRGPTWWIVLQQST